MILSHEYKFVCLNPPKTGTGFRETTLIDYSDVNVEKHKPQRRRHWTSTQASNYIKSINKDIPFLTYRDENSPVNAKQEHLDLINLPKTIHVSHASTSSINITDGTVGNIEDVRYYIAKKILNLI